MDCHQAHAEMSILMNAGRASVKANGPMAETGWVFPMNHSMWRMWMDKIPFALHRTLGNHQKPGFLNGGAGFCSYVSQSSNSRPPRVHVVSLVPPKQIGERGASLHPCFQWDIAPKEWTNVGLAQNRAFMVGVLYASL